MEPVTTVAVTGFAVKTFADVMSTFVSNNLSLSILHNQKKRVNDGISTHIEMAYKKCMYVKTFINPSEPTYFLKIYNNQTFKYESSGVTVDHYDLVSTVHKDGKNLIVTGTGGAGKVYL